MILPDGRRLGYGVYGDPAGFPIIDFHGIPGSRREAALMAELLSREDVCFIGFDRPGYGRSSSKKTYHITDIPEDLIELADHLELKKFAILGYSGGGPFALACAHQIPQRLTAVGIVSGVGPVDIGSAGMHENNRKKFNLAQRFPLVAKILLTFAFSSLQRNPSKLERELRKIWAQMPAPDQKTLQDERYAAGILAITKDAITRRVTGWVNEELLMTSAWGFNLKDIDFPAIFLWHGGQDRNVPLVMGKAVADTLKCCRASFLPEEGHLSLLYNHGVEIITTLITNGMDR
ncbi:MAG TPA: alpha/beta hydrolase [Longilinea sp.]|nr:alpha/beta hydrolase [Longilinea sp.]